MPADFGEKTKILATKELKATETGSLLSPLLRKFG